MPKIYLQRHTRPDIEAQICYGVSDIALRREFESVDLPTILERLNGITVGKIYTSPLSRCFELAKKIKTSLEVSELIVDNRTMELNFGDWELMSWDEIFASTRGKEWFDDYIHCQTPNGESFTQMLTRAESFLADISTLKQDVIVVTHSGFMRALLVVKGRVSPQEAFDIGIEYGTLIEL